MASGPAIRAKISRGLAKIKACTSDVVLRATSVSGGDALLGIGQTTSTMDTVVSPPPSVRQLSADEIATSGGLYQPGDFRFVFAGDQEKAVLLASQIVYEGQILQVKWADGMVIDGTVVAWVVTARTKQKQEA